MADPSPSFEELCPMDEFCALVRRIITAAPPTSPPRARARKRAGASAGQGGRLRHLTSGIAIALALLLVAAVPPTAWADAGVVTLREPPVPKLRFPGDTTLAAEAGRAYARLTVRLRPDENDRGAPDRLAAASAIVLDAAGHLVTAAHVARAAARIEATTADGRRHPARILHIDADQELALLRVSPPQGLTGARTGRRHPLTAGEPVLAVGAARNRFGRAAVGRVRVASGSKPVAYEGFKIQRPVLLRMSITRGFSGGPVVDTEGRLVGMVASFDLDHYYGRFTSGTVYVVPVADILAYRDRVLEDHGAPVVARVIGY